ncbi:MAG: MBOAT family protein [Desulfobulbaceae bacterium]|nr:MAG: MBOAT family protein [Desulfobulbaceae bacterium]
MSISSIDYIAFLFLSFFVYVFLSPRYKIQFLLLLSIVFCSFFGLVSLINVFLCISINYICGLQLSKLHKKSSRRKFLACAVAVNILLLAVYKYLTVIYSFIDTLPNIFFLTQDTILKDFIIPVGLSFYIFQSISYITDVYEEKIQPEESLSAFALYILFFPKFLAGPIERSASLLPQFRSIQVLDFERIRYAMLLILWGLFQKIVIADRLKVFVDAAYANPHSCFGLTVWIAIIFYSFQIYCDFNGYTDIARGSAKLFGVNLSVNFRQPYLAASVQDFWRRWHISLSSWLRDYLYIPLGGGKSGIKRKVINLLVVFLVCGIWHGSNWTFVLWGALHGFFVAFEVMLKRFIPSSFTLNYENNRHMLVAKTFLTFILVSIGWVFFRAESVWAAVVMLSNGFDFRTFSLNLQDGLPISQIILSFFLISFVYVVNIAQNSRSLSNWLFSQSLIIRWIIYYGLIYGIILLPGGSGISNFIYYNF